MKRIPYYVVSVEQGTPEWLEMRLKCVTASQMASIFGLCPYTKREDLLQQKLTGIEPPVNEFKQVLFERAHKAEQVCREFLKTESGIDYKPAVLLSKKCPDLLASLDGFDVESNSIFEAKYSGQKSLDEFALGKIKPSHMIQIQSQLFVSGAERCTYFMLSDTGEARSQTVFPDKLYFKYIPIEVEKFMLELKTLGETK